MKHKIKKIYNGTPQEIKFLLALVGAFLAAGTFFSERFTDPLIDVTVMSRETVVRQDLYEKEFDEHKVRQAQKDQEFLESISALDTKIDNVKDEMKKDFMDSERRIIDKIIELKN